MRQTFFDGAVKNFQVVIPDFGTVAGAFQITSLEFAGEHDGESEHTTCRWSPPANSHSRRHEMANRYRGEIEAEIGGTKRRLVLTLGALAELEDAFGADDLVALTERLGSGRLSARDLTRIIRAGLSGAGEIVSDEDVAAMAVDGGIQGYVRIAAELIAATFGEGDE